MVCGLLHGSFQSWEPSMMPLTRASSHTVPIVFLVFHTFLLVSTSVISNHGLVAADAITKWSPPPPLPTSHPSPLQVPGNGCLDSERGALLRFKAEVHDPDGQLWSWKGFDCCRWAGVTCDILTGSVLKVDLRSTDHSLSSPGSGSLSRMFGSLLQLKSLTSLDLSGNLFHHHIPIPALIGSFKELRYLNLSNSGFAGIIPPQLGNLSHLQYLDLSCGHDVPGLLRASDLQWLSGLSSLTYLALDGANLSSVGPDWVHLFNERLPLLVELHLRGCGLSSIVTASFYFTNFTSLEVLDLSSNTLSSGVPSWLLNISSLVSINMGNNRLHGTIPVGLSELPKLEHLKLGCTENFDPCIQQNLSADVSALLGHGGWRSINTLQISWSRLYGEIPRSIGNTTSLVNLHLPGNNISGGIPSSIGRLCNLAKLRLSDNHLSGELPEFLDPAADRCGIPPHRHRRTSPLPGLVELDFSSNSLAGNLPAWLTELRGLQFLSLSRNSLGGGLPPTIWRLSELTSLDVSDNQFRGNFTGAHLSTLRKLETLHVGGNYLSFNIKSDWVPPFQLRSLNMRACGLGPNFPPWIRRQRRLTKVVLSYNGISSELPTWLRELRNLSTLGLNSNGLTGGIPTSIGDLQSLKSLQLQDNQLTGGIPTSIGNLRSLELLSLWGNYLSGGIPTSIGELQRLWLLFLHNNSLSGGIPTSIGKLQRLQFLTLGSNNLTGGIPKSIGKLPYLRLLGLSNNQLSGRIPITLCNYFSPTHASLDRNNLSRAPPTRWKSDLRELLLSKNMLSGEIPSSLRDCPSLETLALSQNNLYGSIPTWIESLQALRILQLRANRFSGEIPSQISELKLLQILDVAENDLTGSIPEKLGRLRGMRYVVHHPMFDRNIVYSRTLRTKGTDQDFIVNGTFLMTVIDLSGNKLSGEFPESLVYLSGLVALNLSRNLLRGTIPDRIGDMHELQSLDLSCNHFSGRIPPSMTALTFLSFLNLSNNNFSGRIPVGGQLQTFDYAFLGNPHLCGLNLHSNCSRGSPVHVNTNRDAETFFNDSLYLALGLGFAFGLLAPFIILIKKRSWSAAYFTVVDQIVDKLF